jgi:uncharacterized protein (DUF4415 family)
MKGRLMRKLTREQRRDIKAVAAKKDGDIDFSDVAPILDWSRAEMGRFFQPKKKAVTIRLDTDVIGWLKGYGPGYQTKANMLLRTAMLHLSGQKLPASNQRSQSAARDVKRRAKRDR